MKLDFVSDVICPWCAIGLASLEQAIARLGNDIEVDLQLQPFELNPGMPPDGEDLVHYVTRKYGATDTELAARQTLIRQRAAEAGLEFAPRKRVWNTFDAHRLLHWAGTEGRQLELKRQLVAAYHGRGENPGSPVVLLRAAVAAGLDALRARAVIEDNAFADETRARIRHWQSIGIQSVPSIVIDDLYLIQGSLPVAAYERALREADRSNRGDPAARA